MSSLTIFQLINLKNTHWARLHLYGLPLRVKIWSSFGRTDVGSKTLLVHK